jgi:uncharacterized protein YdeI (YjbR/CyaY-like superfamily)
MPTLTDKPTFFPTLERWRAWLKANHAKKQELWVGFYKRDSGRPSITWPESVDGALAFGWIDGVRKSMDAESYVIRFTPRKTTSNWSAVNIKRVGELEAEGLMHESGLRAFRERSEKRSAIYAYEQRHEIVLAEPFAKRLAANAKASRFFAARPTWYRKTATYWVMSAKRDETREKRFATLLADSAAGKTIAALTRPGDRKKSAAD